MIYSPDKATFEKFSEDLQKEYTEKEGVYTLNLSGHEDHLIPKAKKDLAEQHRKAAETKVTEMEASQAELLKQLEAKGKSTKDIEALRKEFEADLAKTKGEYAEREKVALEDSGKAMIKAEAARFAGERFTTPTLIALAYEQRLSVETVEGHQVLRVKEADGKASVKSLSDLQKEFLEKEEYASIVKQTTGSGGGANNPGEPKGGAGGKTMLRSAFDALDPTAQMNVMVGKDSVTLVDD